MENGLSLEDYNKLLIHGQSPIHINPSLSLYVIVLLQSNNHGTTIFQCAVLGSTHVVSHMATCCNHDHIQGLGKSLFALPPGWVWQSGPGRSHHVPSLPSSHDSRPKAGASWPRCQNVMAQWPKRGNSLCRNGWEMFTSVPNAQCKCWRDQRLDNIRPCYSSATI